MNSVGNEEIERLAELAGFELEHTELESLTREIASIIDYFSQIKECSESSGTMQGLGCGTAVRLRLDRIDSTRTIRDPSAFAPAFESGFFLVPRPESIGEE